MQPLERIRWVKPPNKHRGREKLHKHGTKPHYPSPVKWWYSLSHKWWWVRDLETRRTMERRRWHYS